MVQKVRALAFLFGLVVLLGIGCDSGGGESRIGDTGARNATTDGTTTPRTGKAELSGGRVETCSGGSMYLNAKEKKTLELHNRTRTERGIKPLCAQPALTEAARAHSRDMIERDYFSHVPPEGTTLAKRLERHGYTLEGNWKVAENIAWGNYSYGTPEYVFGGWMDSSSHRPHILDGELRQIGVGTHTGTYKGYENATMYTAEFAVPSR